MSSLQRLTVSREEELKCNEGSDQKFVLEYGIFQMPVRLLGEMMCLQLEAQVHSIIKGVSGDRAENRTKD